MSCKNLVFFGGQGTAQQAQKSSLELFPVIWQGFDALWTPPITPKARRGCILPNRRPLPLQEVSEHTCFGGAGSGAATQQLIIGQLIHYNCNACALSIGLLVIKITEVLKAISSR